ncbi:MAG: 3-ketoacyl-ACP reductase [Acidobacteriota bacterium]|nr:3-ketoacyl-ACP reductase [Acidobacteriota bacterium]
MSKHRVALITGAGRGIGRGIALALAGEGFDIAGCDVVYEPENRAAGLFEVQAAVGAAGAEFLPIRADVADLDGHEALLAAVLERYGRIDCLVNNAGVGPKVRADLLEESAESYDRVLGINLRGPFFLTQKAAPHLAALAAREPEARPCIVFITSMSAVVSSIARPGYCISKAGLSMAARLYADRLAGSGVGVYEIRPGIIRTEMTAPVREKYDRMIADGLVPQGRWGEPADIGRAVAALAGGAFGYATGSAVEISGGMDIRRL